MLGGHFEGPSNAALETGRANIETLHPFTIIHSEIFWGSIGGFLDFFEGLSIDPRFCIEFLHVGVFLGAFLGGFWLG
jgi:hypothetical protein